MCIGSSVVRSEQIAKVWLEDEVSAMNNWYFMEHRDICRRYDGTAEPRGWAWKHECDELEYRYNNGIDALVSKALGRGIRMEIIIEVCGVEAVERNNW